MSLKRIFIIEDHPIMREALADVVKNEPGLAVCGTAATGEEALELLAQAAADLVLVDLSLPGISGIALVQTLQAQQPVVPYLMLSGHSEVTYVRRALEVGASGYVLKGNPADILEAIHQVLDGAVYLSAAVKAKLAEEG